ncbi:hypothetical protein F5884DRAFT_878489 [Xylogone sp. PMI_703]|nr:hypothetical protein F5884DRAFT_878489 [Xylogone sp. PMI_703]
MNSQGHSAVASLETSDTHDLEPLTILSECNKKPYISSGLNGTTAIISPYGEVLNISKSITEISATAETKSTIESESIDNRKLRILSLDCKGLINCSRPGMERRREFQRLAEEQAPGDSTGLGLCLESVEADLNPSLSWVNDRWPRVTYSSEGIDISVQFTIQGEDNVLWQQYTITNDTNEDKSVPLFFRTGEMELSSNEPDIDNVYTKPLDADECPIEWNKDRYCVHVEGSKSTAEALIYVFSNGTLITNLEMDDSPIQWQRWWHGRSKGFLVPKNRVQEVTIAYKIQQKDEAEKSSSAYVDIYSFLKNDKPRNAFFERDRIFAPLFRRHLEHILCACSLPLAGTTDGKEYITFTNGNALYPFSATPLCAFFMFRYLLLMYRLLERRRIDDMHTREHIKTTCKRHLRWCFEHTSFPNSRFYPHTKDDLNYTVQDGENTPYFVEGSLHMLKLHEFSKVWADEREFIAKCIAQCGVKWLKGLSAERDAKSKLWYQRNNTPTYIAWEGSRGKPPEWLRIPSFRLGDCIYLWKALKSLEELANQDETNGKKIKDVLSAENLVQHDIRKLIIQRFVCPIPGADNLGNSNTITEINHQQDAMYRYAVAVSRSGSAEADRFLFYAKDTLLYDGLRWGFFKNDSDIDILSAWEATLKSQGADKEVIWQNPLRYGLAIMMDGRLGDPCACLDKGVNPEELAQLSRERLSRCIFPSGLIAERIDWDTKQPILDTDYCDARSTFEIPTLLLRKEYSQADFRLLPSEEVFNIQLSTSIAQSKDIDLEDEDQKRRRIASTKKSIAFEKKKMISKVAIDKSQVFDPENRKKRDWLHPFPDFINPRAPYTNTLKELELLESGLQFYPFKILEGGINSWENRPRERRFSFGPYTCLVVDIAKHGRERPVRANCDPDDLDRLVREGRTVDKAKKRFFYLSPVSTEHALILYLAAPKRERYNVAEFLSHHGNFTAYLREDVHYIANVWTTEFHLAFIQLVPAQGNTYNLSPSKPLLDGFVSDFPFEVANQKMSIFKASLSYRVNGDMDDRYWTGYLLTYLPKQSSVWPKLTYENSTWFEPSSQQDQRKILEPYLVHRMVFEAYNCTRELLEAVDKWVELKTSMDGSFDKLYTRSKVCLDIDGILNQARRMLQTNIANLEAWLAREKTRSAKPRWSEKDELKHGNRRDHYNLQVKQQVSLLKEQSKKVESSINQLVDNLNLAEARTAARSAENVRIFTYATVIFLPLSFVSSLFSMQGTPAISILAPFGRATAVALIITLVIVFNAETLAWPIMFIRFKMSRSAGKRMRETSSKWPLEWSKVGKIMAKLEHDSVLHDDEAPKWPGNKIVYLFYWVVYLLIEFPATCIVLGIQSFASFWYLRKDSTLASNILQRVAWIILGLLLLPMFLIAWSILAVWVSIISTLSAGYQRIKHLLAKAEGKARAKRVWAVWDGVEPNNTAPNGSNENDNEHKTKEKKKDPSPKEKAEENLRKRERKEKRRLKERTSLLVNPLEVLHPQKIFQTFKEEESTEDESDEEHQEEHHGEDEGEDDPEGDGKNSVENAYNEYLDKLRKQKHTSEKGQGPTNKGKSDENHKLWPWTNIRSASKRRVRQAPDIEALR